MTGRFDHNNNSKIENTMHATRSNFKSRESGLIAAGRPTYNPIEDTSTLSRQSAINNYP